jgi:hypothetical protein
MKRSRFSDEQIIGILKEHQAGMPAADLGPSGDSLLVTVDLDEGDIHLYQPHRCSRPQAAVRCSSCGCSLLAQHVVVVERKDSPYSFGMPFGRIWRFWAAMRNWALAAP